MIRFVTPIVLIVSSVLNLMVDMKEHYSGYPISVQIVFGWAMIIILALAAIIPARMKWNKVSAELE